jgi:hypothetical protein
MLDPFGCGKITDRDAGTVAMERLPLCENIFDVPNRASPNHQLAGKLGCGVRDRPDRNGHAVPAIRQ